MFNEDELLPLSGLQHFTFCERRWALVHIEQIWEENRFTSEGELLHERAHSGEVESRPGVLFRRTLPVHSFRLGLSGQVDVVEFQPVTDAQLGVVIEGKKGFWRPHPIEYKRRRAMAGASAYAVQLCAQALCMEEMLGCSVDQGAIYDGAAKRRQIVEFTSALRTEVESAAERMHEMFSAGRTPPPVFTKACAKCSLVERCQPASVAKARPVERYLAAEFHRAVKERTAP